MSMNVRNCRMCGRIFNYVTGSILCQGCREKMEIKFQEVKEYIRAHPGVGIPEVSAACDVDPNQIRQWLRDERLEVAEDSAIYLSCEGCGAPIRSGRFCDRCKNTTAQEMRTMVNKHRADNFTKPEPKNTKDSAKMRFL